MRIAAIDIGTNTVQLLVVGTTNGELNRLHTGEKFVRLGEGMNDNGQIKPAAADRLVAALKEYVDTSKEYGADTVAAAATSALREAANRVNVLNRINEGLDLPVEILSGEEEAAWSFAAACSAFPDLEGRMLVVDIGGGSTELITGTDPARHHPIYPNAITDQASLDVGCVHLTERWFSQQPPSRKAITSVEQRLDRSLSAKGLDLPAGASLIGTAGTATALALIDAGPTSTWDALHGDGFRLSHSDVHGWRERVLTLTTEEILQLHPEAMTGRADVFPVGVILLDRIMTEYGLTNCLVSPYELRHGLALRTLASKSNSSTQFSS